jgi:membrane associated rhomboid family serine protease
MGTGGDLDDGRARIEPEAKTPREPAIRAPAPVLTLALLLVALFVLQGFGDDEAVLRRFGFSPLDLADGRWSGLFTSMFVHGNWPHVILNALGALAFGAPVARLMGHGAAGGARFYSFYIICGVVAALGYAALHPGEDAVLVGASGAVAGLMGAASRLLESRRALAPFRSRTVVGMAAAWIVINLMMGFVGIDAISGGASIAWEAHLFGYAAGLFLIGPAARLAGWRPLAEL